MGKPIQRPTIQMMTNKMWKGPSNLMTRFTSFTVGLLVYAAIFTNGNETSNGATTTKTDLPTGKRIAIIGGSISGSFFAKYISDYDAKCQIGSITIYDPYAIPTSVPSAEQDTAKKRNVVSPSAPQPDDQGQGPRVSSLALADGYRVELGASIIYSDNRLVVEMMEGDPSMKPIEPHAPTSSSLDTSTDAKKTSWEAKHGFGIYNGPLGAGGNPIKPGAFDFIWPILTANLTSVGTTALMLWRYNLDLWRMRQATTIALDALA